MLVGHPKSLNFEFLRAQDDLLYRLCASAEHYCVSDPNVTLLKLRQFGEALAQHLAASFGVPASRDTAQADLLGTLQRQGHVDRDIAAVLHALRREGNEAAHRFETRPGQAKEALKLARTAAIWFHRAFGKNTTHFQPGGFRDPVLAAFPPAPPVVKVSTQASDAALAELEQERRLREAAEQRAEVLAQDRSLWEQLAQDEERQRLQQQAEFEARIDAIRQEALARTPAQAQLVTQAVAAANARVELDEAETRSLIDAQLRDAGWEADTVNLRFSKGVRPEAGRNLAISEWPTSSGPADYVLFAGMTAIAVIEAKKFGTDVASVWGQAERYSLGYQVQADEALPSPSQTGTTAFAGWVAGHATVTGATHYRIPFVFASNGRPYHRQFLTRSGVWFRDVRSPTNHASALDGWHTPAGLLRLLAMDVGAAEQALLEEPFGYLNLRDYQVKAVQAVEAAISQGTRQCLIAMATGTGKTRTVIGLLYRLLKAQRFHRILFLVDRKDLGTQAQDAFKGFRLEQDKLFTEVFELKELEDAAPDSQTRVHVATVQGMVHRLFSSEGEQLPIDRYDFIVVDEAHRGYTLDREMGEGEVEFRSEADYVSAYRRVLDHFDAVKVALTATPAQHTTQIFGLPVYNYSYREAVIDGWLIDHEPPIRLITKLSEEGIHFDKGSQVDIFVPGGHVHQQVLPDELDFEVDAFNRLVITENFNRVVSKYLAKELDPYGLAKTLMFCANDAHADLVVALLREALEAEHGPLNDKTVLKITGKSDRLSQLIRLFKNEPLPKIAVTVDLLTTGIDVPAIVNLVFLRRVRSRILYEQMLGRATRLCPDIGKEFFRIYDAVDLYQALDAVNTMRPVVVAPDVSLQQLLLELADPQAHKIVTGSTADGKSALTHADDVAAQLKVRVRNLLRRALGLAPKLPAAKNGLDKLRLLTGTDPSQFVADLRKLSAQALHALFAGQPSLVAALQSLQFNDLGSEQVVSTHHDEFVDAVRGYGRWTKPEDYLDAFQTFVNDNRNRIAALDIVVTRPRDLTREHLKELQVILAQHDFTARTIAIAWKQAKNEDIAATLIGYIRQLALGSPLVPFDVRVNRALERLLARRSWTQPQQRWLQRIATAVKGSWVVDAETFNQGAWIGHGGLKTLNQAFDGDALQVVRDLEHEVWSDAA